MRATLERHGRLFVEKSAYYFRYFEPFLNDRQQTAAVLAHEEELIAAGLFEGLGRRYLLDPE